LGGAIGLPTARQTWVGTGVDPMLLPIVHLPTTAQGSAGAVRIGNAVAGSGCELLSKTFLVTAAQTTINFWYAFVSQYAPGQPTGWQPFFWVDVRVGNAVVPHAVDLGGNNPFLTVDPTNPYFGVVKRPDGLLYYTDWRCAQIDLSSVVNKVVTIRFITGDSADGKYYGYAYIDNLCGRCKGSAIGDLRYNCESSSHCGNGKICFDYDLPQSGGPGDVATYQVYGNVTIALEIYQNGQLKATLTSPQLTTGKPQGSYCFDIVPAAIPGLDLSLGGFDFSGKGTFSLPWPWGNTTVLLGDIRAGDPPYGITPGQNNDYRIVCPSCEDIGQEQEAYLRDRCAKKVNVLPRLNCHCPGVTPTKGDCDCKCVEAPLPDLRPCISVRWGDVPRDCIKTKGIETLCVTVCNCYSNVTFEELTIARIAVTDAAGNPVALLPDGTPSVQLIPSGPLCFGDVPPCKGHDQPMCVSRQMAIDTRGATGKDYRLSFEGVCFTVSHHAQIEQCFALKLCPD
jgi:hypothetical protein